MHLHSIREGDSFSWKCWMYFSRSKVNKETSYIPYGEVLETQVISVFS